MENWNLGAILQELENRQNPPFAPPLHSGYPSPRNRLEATVSQNGCSQRPPSSQSVWDHHLSCVSYTQTGKGQENVINHSHLWGLSLSQIHVLSCFQLCILNYQQKKNLDIFIASHFPILGLKQFSATTGACRKSASCGTRFLPSMNVTPQNYNLLFQLPRPLWFKKCQTLKRQNFSGAYRQKRKLCAGKLRSTGKSVTRIRLSDW